MTTLILQFFGLILVFNLVSEVKAATVSGKITNVVNDAPLKYATVTISKNKKIVSTAHTNSEGYFFVTNLPAGSYDVKSTKVHFGSISVASVALKKGNEVSIDLMLTPVSIN